MLRTSLFFLTACSIVCLTRPPHVKAEAANLCSVSQADLIANDKLNYEDFDQKGVLPSTWRALDNKQCYQSSISVMQDYLINGPTGTPTQRQDLLFHLGQSLGMAGRNSEAALVIAGARQGELEPNGFDWATYVVGTWAFLVRDRSKLQAMRDKLRTEPGNGNLLNTKVLNGLINCFDKPYRDAYSKLCRE